MGQGSGLGSRPPSSRLGPRRTRGRIVPAEVPGPENTAATVSAPGCGLRRPSLPASMEGWAGHPCPSLVLALPQPVGETDVRGHRQSLVLYATPCLSTPTTTLSFPRPPTPQGALTSDLGESMVSFPHPPTVQRETLRPRQDLGRIYRHLWQSGWEHELGSHIGLNLPVISALLFTCCVTSGK